MHPTHTPPSTAEVTQAAEVTPADVLRAAALYIGRHGWTQGSYYATGGAFDGVRQTYHPGPTPAACALGAIAMAAYGQPVDDPYDPDRAGRRDFTRAAIFFADYLDIRHGDFHPDLSVTDLSDGPDVGTWNDQDGRTAQQVIAALHAAADDWEHTHTGGAR